MLTKKRLCVLVGSVGLSIGVYASVASALAQCHFAPFTQNARQCLVVVNGITRESRVTSSVLPPITFAYAVDYRQGVNGGLGQAFPCDANGKGVKETNGTNCPMAGDLTKDFTIGLQKSCTSAAPVVQIGVSST